MPELNSDQTLAVEKILEFLRKGEGGNFVLAGPAGTGKTFCIKEVAQKFRDRLIFTAPTNKATKVIRETFQNLDLPYSPECRTIYSLLGLRMEPSGEVKVLSKPDRDINLSRFAGIVVDEASMINSHLWGYICANQKKFPEICWIFMGDMCQLPPVGEPFSPVWQLPDQVHLQKVMRHDNQILTLATSLREVMDNPFPSLSISSNWEEGEGVLKVREDDFLLRVMKDAEAGVFSSPSHTKAIAWRNATVNLLNSVIRKQIYPQAWQSLWLPEDRIICLEPVQDFLEEEILATTDEEGTIERVMEDYHPEYQEFKVFRILAQMDQGHPVTFYVLHPDMQKQFKKRLADLAAEAKLSSKKWFHYWRFRDSFHNIRHGYAITAHRAQGSTYNRCYVNSFDIMLNPNKSEAFRCLYVAVTRARKEIILI